MKLARIFTIMLISLPAIYATLKFFIAFKELNLLVIIGFVSLIFLSLDILSEIILAIMLISASLSFTFLFFGDPIPILSMATGQVLSLNLILLTATRNEIKAHIRLIAYLISILISMMILKTLETSPSPDVFILSFLKQLSGFPAFADGSSDNIFLILIAPSILGVVSTISPSNPTITSLIMRREVSMASLLAALLVLTVAFLSPEIAWITSILIALAVTILLLTCLMVIE